MRSGLILPGLSIEGSCGSCFMNGKHFSTFGYLQSAPKKFMVLSSRVLKSEGPDAK